MTVPVWVWAASAAALIVAVAAEVALTGRPGRGTFTARQAAGWVGVYVSLAVLFGLALGMTAGWVTAGQFYTGYLTEYSLSLDNLFVFSAIMAWFAVPPGRQPRVLLFGIGLAVVLRSVLIVAGAAALGHFGWLFYPLGAVLVWTAFGLMGSSRPGDQADHEPERPVRLPAWLQRRVRGAGRQEAERQGAQRQGAQRQGRERQGAQRQGGERQGAQRQGRERQGGAGTPLLLLIGAIGLADLLFAFDSIPAVFGITTSALLVVACNVFALMGLRQLYTLLAGVLGRLPYLNTGLGLICAFIGVKLLLEAVHSSVPAVPLVPAWLSVLVVAGVLAATVIVGVLAGRPATVSAERTMLERRFAVVDTDGNGMWQRADYQLLTRRLCETFGLAADSAAGRALASAQRTLFDTMVAHMDANGDCVISRKEFVAAVGPGIGDRPGFEAAVEAAARSLIQVADTDGNGVLDAAEYTRLAAVYGARADEAERAFGRLDQDRNGVLDAAELTLAIRQFFASRDPGARGSAAFGYG